MKRPSTWAGIIGGLLVAGFGYALAEVLTNPTNLFWVNVAMIVSNLSWVALGGFLIALFVKWRQKEDAENGQPKPIPDSPEDVDRMARQRNWILGFVLVIETIGSIEPWFLNNYTAGLTLINIAVIFDLLVHVAFAYIIFELFRGRKNVLPLLFYSVLVYAGGWILFNLLREHWVGALVALMLGSYFIYAIKAPLTRRNYRIAHFVLLPAYIILLSTYPLFDNGNIPELTKQENLAEQQFLNESGALNGAYVLFLQHEAPGKREFDEIRSSIARRETKIAEIVSLVEQLQEEYKKQLPTVAQKKTLERMRYFLQIMQVHRAQAAKLEEMVAYAEKLNFNVLTDKQISDLQTLKEEIDAFNARITEIQFEQSKANVNE